MMNAKFNIQVLKFKTIEELPNSWNLQNFKDLLELMDYQGVSEIKDEEIKEMCFLSLTDFETNEAAEIVLKYLFSDSLSIGQIDNLSNEIVNEKMWEEYPELSFHEKFFNAGQLLYKAFNGKFPHPEAVQFNLEITANKLDALKDLDKWTEVQLLRLIAYGMPENTLLKRLFSDQLVKGDFTDAKDILWQTTQTAKSDTSVSFSIVSSLYWFHDLKNTSNYDVEVSLDEFYE